MRYAFFFLLLLLVAFTKVNGQDYIPDVTFPVPREKASFIYHPPGNALLFIAGSTIIPDTSVSDVWKWDGKKLSIIKAEGPGTRAFFPGALNTKTREGLVVMKDIYVNILSLDPIIFLPPKNKNKLVPFIPLPG